MLDFTIHHIGRYTAPETHRQEIHCPWLAFYIKGIRRNRLFGPDGSLIDDPDPDTPFFRFGLPGMTTEFESTRERENWVILFDELPLRYSGDTPDILEIEDGNSRIPVPLSVTMSRDECSRWSVSFNLIHTLLKDPVPAHVLQAKMEVIHIIHYILYRHEGPAGSETPAAMLKRLIDEDAGFRKSLAELGQETPYSIDHLRILFEHEFGIRPNQYRHRRQMVHVMDYITGSTLNIKQIADRTGFKHTSHLCLAFKKEFGMSPGEGIRRYRYGNKR